MRGIFFLLVAFSLATTPAFAHCGNLCDGVATVGRNGRLRTADGGDVVAHLHDQGVQLAGRFVERVLHRLGLALQQGQLGFHFFELDRHLINLVFDVFALRGGELGQSQQRREQ